MDEKIRTIIAYGNYFNEFIRKLPEDVVMKFYYVFTLLETRERLSSKFVKPIRNGLYELRVEYDGNIYRAFFIFDKGRLVILFNGFQKKTQKIPNREIEKALRIMEEYYADKKQ